MLNIIIVMVRRSLSCAVCLSMTALLFIRSASAQQLPPGGQNPNANQVGGISIDAEGLIDLVKKSSIRPAQSSRENSKPRGNGATATLRKVSLPRLDRALAKVQEQQLLLDRMQRQLSGLTRIDYLIVDEDGGDLILAGPAEEFIQDEQQIGWGRWSGRPTVRLDDWLVIWRSLQRHAELGCSIDPDPARLAQLQRFVAQNNSPALPAVVEQRFQQMTHILGNHHIRVFGVAPDSQVARVLVEADYRMKLIALGLNQPIPGIRSHLSFLTNSGNSMQRWWFVPLLEELTFLNETIYHWSGPRWQLVSQEEYLDSQGKKNDAPHTRWSTQAFAKHITEKYHVLADHIACFAELQNLLDLSLVAILIEEKQLLRRTRWTPVAMLDADNWPHQRTPIPRQTRPMFNVKRVNSGMVVGVISGGVVITGHRLLQRSSTPEQSIQRELSLIREQALSRRPANDDWWWD